MSCNNNNFLWLSVTFNTHLNNYQTTKNRNYWYKNKLKTKINKKKSINKTTY